MKFTYSSLLKLLKTTATPREISDALVDLGLEVESLDDARAQIEPFVLAKIIEAGPHPDADRLQVCTVDYGAAEKLQIVCGAPNARKGIKVALALAGVIIPATGDKLKKGKVRGVESEGMMCSTRELNLGDDHDGIMELQTDLPLGTSLAEIIDAPIIFDVSITPNRGDCFSVYGIARDLAAKGIGTLNAVEIPALDQSKTCDDLVTITTDKCEAFGAVLIEGVTNAESPACIQNYLKNSGMKSISALVDVTNFINHYYGRPLHVFDADTLKGPLHVRDAKSGEKIKALDEETYDLIDSDVVVADDCAPQAIAGVMGGLDSGCQMSTTRVVLEGALFNPTAITRTGQRLNIHSDARTRFERGVDSQFTLPGIEKAVEMILKICGGSVTKWQWLEKKPYTSETIEFSPSLYEKRTGCTAQFSQGKAIFENLGMQVDDQNHELWKVQVPSWRHDLSCAEDLVEEWLRVAGYDHLPSTPLPAISTKIEHNLLYEQQKMARRILTIMGYDEAITWSFTSEEDAKSYGCDHLARIQNPLSLDQGVMRPSVVMSLIEVAKRNMAYGVDRGKIFEIGKSYTHPQEDNFKEANIVASLLYGMNHPRHWKQKQEKVDFYTIKANLLQTFDALGIPTANLTWQPFGDEWLHPGQSAQVSLGKNTLAKVGVMHPKLSGKVAMAAFEIYMDQLPPVKNKLSAKVVSEFPAVTRDFAFNVAQDFCGQTLCQTVSKVDQKLIKDVYIFDNYVDPQTSQRSVAVEVKLQSDTQTLSEEMITDIYMRIVASCEKVLGITLKL